jgi:hypothetical protein
MKALLGYLVQEMVFSQGGQAVSSAHVITEFYDGIFCQGLLRKELPCIVLRARLLL